MQTLVSVSCLCCHARSKEQARAAGLDKSDRSPVHWRSRTTARMAARGYQGEMKWMSRDPEQRTDPRAFFPPARSVIGCP